MRFAVDSMCYNERNWLMDRAHTNTKSSMQYCNSVVHPNAFKIHGVRTCILTKGGEVRATYYKVCKVKESSSSYEIVPSFRLYSIL